MARSRVSTTHYEVLGVQPTATVEEIRSSYRRIVRRLHPDVVERLSAGEARTATVRLTAATDAYDVLVDPDRRRAYDREVGVADLGPRTGSAVRPEADAPPARPLPPGFVDLDDALFVGRRAGGYRARRRRMAAHDPGLSLKASTADLSLLEELAPDGVWRLSCRDVPVGDDTLRPLRALHGLRDLDLTGTAVTDAGVAHLAGLRGLESLALCETAVTDQALRILTSLPRLQAIHLRGTAVTDDGLAHLAVHSELDVLDVRETAVTGRGLSALSGLADLDVVIAPHLGILERRRARRALPKVRLL